MSEDMIGLMQGMVVVVIWCGMLMALLYRASALM
jgi:hypothetical protein